MGRLTYKQFRCGVTFQQVREELAAEQRIKAMQGEYMFVSRSTVLGRMRQHKLEAWDYYCRGVEENENRSVA